MLSDDFVSSLLTLAFLSSSGAALNAFDNMRALPPTRVPCYYPAPLAEMTSVAELNLKYELEAESRDVEVRVQAFAVAVRAMMGTTAEFAYWLDEDRLVFVESIDEHGAAEKYEVVARADVQCMYCSSFDARLSTNGPQPGSRASRSNSFKTELSLLLKSTSVFRIPLTKSNCAIIRGLFRSNSHSASSTCIRGLSSKRKKPRPTRSQS